MSGFSKVCGMGGIDLTKWSDYEISQLIKIAQNIQEDRIYARERQLSESDKNIASNCLGSTDRGENGLYGDNYS